MSDSVFLKVVDVTKSFGGFQLLKGVSMELRKGDVVLLRGDNGSGKTTLLNILTGNLTPDSGEIVISVNARERRFRFPQAWLQELDIFNSFSPEQMSRECIGRSWQDLRLFDSLSIFENLQVAAQRRFGEDPVTPVIYSSLLNHQEAKNTARTIEILGMLGLNEIANDYPDVISLGNAKRVSLARTLQAESKVLFLDEPFSGLDGDGITEMLHLLRRIAADQNITIVVVEHSYNIPRLLEFVTKIWTLRDGHLFEETTSEIRSELRGLQADGLANWFSKIVDDGRGREYRSLYRGAELEIFSNPTITEPREVLQVSDWIVERNNQLVVGEDQVGSNIGLDLRLCEGDVAVLRAPNGWGKTTLAESLMGLIPCKRGSATIRGERFEKMPTWDRARKGMVFLQSRGQVFTDLKVSEMMRLGNVFSYPAFVNELIARPIHQLSGGERQRIAVASCLGRTNRRLLILDEPFGMLDTESVIEVQRLLLAQSSVATLVLVPGLS